MWFSVFKKNSVTQIAIAITTSNIVKYLQLISCHRNLSWWPGNLTVHQGGKLLKRIQLWYLIDQYLINLWKYIISSKPLFYDHLLSMTIYFLRSNFGVQYFYKRWKILLCLHSNIINSRSTSVKILLHTRRVIFPVKYFPIRFFMCRVIWVHTISQSNHALPTCHVPNLI